MKKKTQYRRTELKEVTILGRKIFFHTSKREVIFPQGMDDIEIEWISVRTNFDIVETNRRA